MDAASPRSAATIEEVAARAGVSRSTVSRVVNGSTAVSPAALESVRRAIEELSFVPNRAARSLARRQTHAVAFVVPEDTERFFGDPFFAAIVAGVNERVVRSDYVLNVIIASGDPDDKATSYLRSGSVDGAIVASHHTSDAFVARIAAVLPVVYGGRPLRPTPGDRYVDVDNVGGAERATEHLIGRGCRRLATITGPQSMVAGVDRLDGFDRALTAAGLTACAVEEGDFTEAGGAAAMRRVLARGDAPDGVFVASDLMARGALGVLRGAGLSVPGDVAIVGFDDSTVATSVTPALTTVRQPSREQGSRMAEVLLAMLAGETVPPATVLPTELIVRASA